MVTLKQVFKISSFVGILNLSVSVANTATEVNFVATSEGVQVELPVDLIKVQAVLDEGTQVELSEAQVEEMLPWAQNSKVFLEDLLERVKALPLSDKFDQAVSGIKDSVLSSAPKNTELLMRYVLNRSLKVVEVIDEQVGTEKNTSTLNVQFNMLKDSIKLAIKYYKNDLSFLNNQVVSDNLVAFSRFGMEYTQFLYQYTKLVVDASAQYQLMRMTLGFLQWDLYRDQDNKLYAPIIITIDHELSNNPKDLGVSDQEYLKRVRNMKRTYEQQREKTSVIAKQSHSYHSVAGIDTLPIKKDDRVIFKKGNDYYTGVVVTVFEDGKIRIDPDITRMNQLYGDTSGDKSPMEASEIGKGVACFNKICKDDRVIFKKGNDYYTGVVDEVFNNGKIKIDPDRRSMNRLYGDISEDTSGDVFNAITLKDKSPMEATGISKGVACSTKICKGDRVMFKKGNDYYVGVVDEVFNNGKIKIDPDRRSMNRLYRSAQEFTKVLDE